MKNYACVCCGFLTLSSPSRDTFEICPVCYWQDDIVQFQNHDFSGGSNEISLNQARENFAKYAVSNLQFKNLVRAPKPQEFPSTE